MKKDWVARELTIEVLVGGFMVMLFLGLVYFTIILSRDTWFGEKPTLEVVFKDVMGLRQGDTVAIHGMAAGKVQSLVLKEDGVHVTATLDGDMPVRMRNDYGITIASKSILGGWYLRIDEGTPNSKPVPEGMVFRGEEAHDLMADAAALVNAARKGIVEGGVIDNIREASAQIKEMTARVNSGKGMIGRLFSEDDTLYNDLSAAVASIKNISERLEKGQGTLGKLVAGDDALYDALSATATSLRNITAKIEKGEGLLGRMIQDDEIADNVAATVSSLKNISGKIEKGEGFLGRMIQDEGMYEQIEGMIREIRATIDDFRETTPVVTFTSILLGAF